MESIPDSYLHKKFKKQLSIEPKFQNYETEIKDPPRLEPGKEKILNHRALAEIKSEEKTLNFRTRDPCESQRRLDNSDCVPNQSTNQYNSSTFLLNANFSKSSISVENCIANQQSSNSYISYVVSNQGEQLPPSFDTKFNDATNYNVSTSSILNNVYSTTTTTTSTTQQYANPEEGYSMYNMQDDYSGRPNPSEDTSDQNEVQPAPDKSSSGKHVCPYCSLVCSKPSVLQKHIRAHTNERPYPCKSCGFSFKTRSNLYKHCRSRTHANRVMGNKTQESSNDMEIHKPTSLSPKSSEGSKEDQTLQKPYKPRFHTAKQFFENIPQENIEEDMQNNKHPASDIITHHINEIINKNNSIVNSNDAYIKSKFSEDGAVINDTRYNRIEPVYQRIVSEQRTTEEPLNLTNKNRKRSLSEVTEPVIQKSLIKELLLKNLSSSDMQCPYCKMIFQTVTELDVHKYRSCKGKPSGVKYTRSSSVNVASILTQNKNAFDNIPQLQNTVFPLNSPGPFLGKTRLVESDKTKSFSFDGGHLPMGPSEPSPNYLLSPLQFDKEKKPSIKLFGGEVKVHSSGETKSFIIDGKEDKYESESNFIDYGGKLSENRVIQSSLQSGGTVLTNKGSYNKQDLKASQEVIRVYENSTVSPSIDIGSFNKTHFNFDVPPEVVGGLDNMHETVMLPRSETTKIYPSQPSPLSKYPNITDFSQKAVKMLIPNIRQPNFAISGITTPSSKSLFNNIPQENKFYSSKPNMDQEIESMAKKQYLQNLRRLQNEPKAITPTNNLFNPLNLLVNGKVVRHVPGMPGPVAAESPVDTTYSSNIVAVVRPMRQNLTSVSPLALDKAPTPSKVNDFLQPEKPVESKNNKSPPNNFLLPEKLNSKSPNNVAERSNKSPKLDNAEVKTDFPPKAAEVKMSARVSESKPSDAKAPQNDPKKFARPNSLALKPTTASLKQHHGLTPTMFNQILISPDTPRVAKKYAEHLIQGNYFSYLGLKSSTKPVYCTLNKTQPFYVPHFKKLSMYSEWRQQDTKQDRLYVSNYDSRQKSQRYSVAGKASASLIMHSSYKFIVSEVSSSRWSEKEDDQQKNNALLGGYECNDDYTYIRGRGRGRYVCDQCGIRCKKPSMLIKHIKTHSNDRPYTCNHCKFSFKTKGNLTKHMKSKAHTKNYTASSGSSCSTQHSVHSSDYDTEDSGMDSSDESTRQQEHEAAYGLLSLSQKPTPSNSDLAHLRSISPNDLFMTSEEIAYVSKTNYAKNKILNEHISDFNSKSFNEISTAVGTEETTEALNVRNCLGKSSVNRPLTYPYTTVLPYEKEILRSPKIVESSMQVSTSDEGSLERSVEPKSIKQFHVIQKYLPAAQLSPKVVPENHVKERCLSPTKHDTMYPSESVLSNNKKNVNSNPNRALPTLKINDVAVINENANDLRKRKFSPVDNSYKHKIQRNDEVMDLSITTTQEKPVNSVEDGLFSNTKSVEQPKNITNEIYNTAQKIVPISPKKLDVSEDKDEHTGLKSNEPMNNNNTVIILRPIQVEEQVNVNYLTDHQSNSNDQGKISDYDNSAMETLADIATKQVKLEKNTLAKSVATEFLKLATKNENSGCRDSAKYGPPNKDVVIIVKSEGNQSCTICAKNFNKPSQLRLHMNIHYLERPFRCDSCSVSFRTKGHLQKHERSAGHHNKLSSSPALSSSEPRPFKCSDCNIAFRIHGHLAKHLRSKMHIMKLECLAKIPFGLYAELERSNSLLTEINTCDGDQCLESLKILAKKVFINNPSKLHDLVPVENITAD